MESNDLTRAIDDLARPQHGLVTSQQACDLLGAKRKDYWVATSRLIPAQPRVFRLTGAPRSWHQELMAAQLSADGVVSHRSAAEMWGLLQPGGHVEVSVRAPRKARLRPPAVVHRIADLHVELAEHRDGIRMTDPVRTLVDLGLVLPAWSVDRALKTALTSRLVAWETVRWLREALGRRGRNGTGVIGDLLERRMLTAATEESPLESELVDVLRDAGLRLPVFQHEVWHAGRFVARVDAAYPAEKIAIEVDGYLAHADPDAFQRDRTRQNELVRLGWTVLRFTWVDVTRRPAEVVATIALTLRRHAA